MGFAPSQPSMCQRHGQVSITNPPNLRARSASSALFETIIPPSPLTMGAFWPQMKKHLCRQWSQLARPHSTRTVRDRHTINSFARF